MTMRHRKWDRTAGDFVWLYLQDGKENDKLEGLTEGSFMVLDCSMRTLDIQQCAVAEGFSSDRITKSPTTTDARPREGFYAMVEDLQRNNTTGRDYLEKSILEHHTDGVKTLEFQMDSEGDY